MSRSSKQAWEASSLGSDQYRQTLDDAPDAILMVDASGVVSYVNRRVSEVFGFADADLVGRPLDHLLPERHRSTHGHKLARYFASPVARPMSASSVLAARRADGAEIEIEVSLSPVRTRDGLLVAAAVRDVTERRRLEARARLTAERLASAVDSIDDALAVFSSDDRVVLHNAACSRLFGDHLGALHNRPFADLLDAWLPDLVLDTADDLARFRAARLSERAEERATFDVRTRRGRSLRVILRRALDGGRVQIFFDRTDDVRRQQELRAAQRAAEEASAAKIEFLASMSHELRTPLNAILGFAQLLQRDRRDRLSPRHAERAAHIVRGGERLLHLLDDVLDLAGVESGRASLSVEPVVIRDVLDEVRATLQGDAERGGVAIVIASDDGVARADRTRFAQIVMNLASNAIKYNRPGGSARFETSREGDRLRLAVVDTGLGIPLDKQPRLFEPFERAGRQSGPIEGTGMGLVIAKRLAELMAGRLGFESVPGAGSRFWVDVPSAAHPVDVPAPRGKARRTSFAERARVLYIEDNPANIAVIRDAVDALDGYELTTAPTAEMGIELAMANPPDVIIMDIHLPGMTGLEALHRLRTHARTRSIRVVALTAAASDSDRQRGLRAGFDGYLTKPVELDLLRAALEAATRRPPP